MELSEFAPACAALLSLLLVLLWHAATRARARPTKSNGPRGALVVNLLDPDEDADEPPSFPVPSRVPLALRQALYAGAGVTHATRPA